MASEPPPPPAAAAAGLEDECREIHDAACGQPRRLGRLLAHRSAPERQRIRAAYRATFGEDLAGALLGNLAANQDQDTELCRLLHLWTLEPAERDAIVAREAVEGGGGGGGVTVAGYRALVEVFTRRKQNQLFFTKQAYLARFRRSLEQDMATEPPHPYQRARTGTITPSFSSFFTSPPLRCHSTHSDIVVVFLGDPNEQLLVALAASHKSHHDELSQHIAKCDARRLHDAKNGGGGGGSVVDEAVILEVFSKRSIPQLRLAFCSYKHIYGHDYTKALKANGSGEFEESLRVVVKCIYNPSKYYSKLLQTSVQCAAPDKKVAYKSYPGQR